MGDWDGPLFGQLGVLHLEDGKIECHCCGRWYRFLATHVWRTHEISADEYRALFGLTARHGLVSPDMSERLRRTALRTLRPYYERAADLARSIPFEQRSAHAHRRRLRLETRLDPKWQDARRRVAQGQAERTRAWYRALDPASRSAFLARIRRPRTPATCVVCGQQFYSASHGPRAKTCSLACARDHRRQLGLALRTASRPNVRATIAVAARRRRAEYDRTVAALQGLDAEAFAILPVAERDLVRRYYGLAADGRPHSRRELMEQTGMARYALQRLLRHGVRLLLDPVTAGLAATCVVCGAAFTRDDVGSARVTCSPACARQRRLTTMRQGGFERISAAARERGRSARAQLRDLDARHPALFAALPERDRLIVRLYHGLPVEGLTVERPWTIREIVGYLGAGASQWKVGDTLHRGVERLLRPDEARSDAERQAAKVARMSAAARERGRAGAEALRALPAAAFERLPELERRLVRRYYGLEDGRPWTRRELAAACGRSTEWVARAVTTSAAHLLGEQAPRPAERACLVCGQHFGPEPGIYRSARKTCSEICNRELRSRNTSAFRAAPRAEREQRREEPARSAR